MNILNKIIKYSTLLFVFLIPWQARLILTAGSINNGYWEYGTQSLYATEILLLVLLIALISKYVIAIKRNKPNFSIKNLNSLVGLIAVVIVFSGLSILWSIDKSVALEHWVVLIEAGVVFLILYSRAISFDNFLWTIIASGFFQAVLAITQSFLQFVPSSTILGIATQSADILGASVVETDSSRWLRAYGSFPHPNILGGWLVISLMSLITVSRSLVVESVGKKDRTTKMRFAIRYLVFGVLIFGLLVTFSRSAWLSALVGIGIFVALSFKDKIFKPLVFKLTGILVLVVILFGFMYPDQFSSRINNQNRLEVKSNTERADSLAQGWNIIKQNRFLGTGIGNYGLSVHKNIDSTQPAYYYQPVHNVFLLIWAELGVFGLIGILILINFVLVIFRKKRDFVSLIVLLPLVVIMLFDHYFWTLYSGIMIFSIYLSIFLLVLGKKDRIT